MKKTVATIICLIALSAAAIPASAQTRGRWVNEQQARQDRRYDHRNDNRYNNQVYRNDVYRNDAYRNNYWNDNRSFWDQHRDKLTTAGGAVAGTVLGALVGGRKGAVIGAIAGGGGAALYTYGIRDGNRYQH